MTAQDLIRGNEISRDLKYLRSALSNLNGVYTVTLSDGTTNGAINIGPNGIPFNDSQPIRSLFETFIKDAKAKAQAVIERQIMNLEAEFELLGKGGKNG